MRGRKGVAVELGVDRDRAHLVDHTKLADVHVHLGLDRQLPHRLEDGQARLHRPRAPGADEASSVENQHAAARVAKGKLDRREALVGARDARVRGGRWVCPNPSPATLGA